MAFGFDSRRGHKYSLVGRLNLSQLLLISMFKKKKEQVYMSYLLNTFVVFEQTDHFIFLHRNECLPT